MRILYSRLEVKYQVRGQLPQTEYPQYQWSPLAYKFSNTIAHNALTFIEPLIKAQPKIPFI
jgi:hypothetical protein